MTQFQTAIAILAAILLFIHGLQNFSRELQTVGGLALRKVAKKVTANRWIAFFFGAASTAVIQSSSAVTSLVVALVDAGVLTFRGSLGLLLGANVGTTATAWLVSFNLTGIGPFFIVLGGLLSGVPTKLKVAGKALFYFGLIFFGLQLISDNLRPLQQEPVFQTILLAAENPIAGLLAGIILTAIIQSSSVTTGLVIILVQQGILPPEAAIPVVLGSNVGSTSTALIASLGAGKTARAAATSNFIFNLTGMIIFLPFIVPFSNAMVAQFADPAFAVAWAHLIFNLSVGLIFLINLRRVGRALQNRLLPIKLHEPDPQANPDQIE